MSSVTKRQAGSSDADKLAVGYNLSGFDGRLLLILSHAKVVVAQSVESVWIIVNFVVKVHAAGRDLDDNTSWDGLAVGEGEGLEDLTLEGSFGMSL